MPDKSVTFYADGEGRVRVLGYGSVEEWFAEMAVAAVEVFTRDALLSDALVDELIEIITGWTGETGTDYMAVTVKVREALTATWTGEPTDA